MTIVPNGPTPPRINPELALHAALSQYTGAGYRVESMTARTAVLATGSPCNHTLHALLTFFTCGLWALVWLALGLTQKVHRVTITVNEHGHVFFAQGEGTR